MVRSEISARSYSASAAKIPNTIWPAGVVVSRAAPWPVRTFRPTPRPVRSCTVFTRWCRFRPSRSSFHTTRVSPLRSAFKHEVSPVSVPVTGSPRGPILLTSEDACLETPNGFGQVGNVSVTWPGLSSRREGMIRRTQEPYALPVRGVWAAYCRVMLTDTGLRSMSSTGEVFCTCVSNSSTLCCGASQSSR